MKMSLKLISPSVMIELENTLMFKKIKLIKFRHRVSEYNRELYLIIINDYNSHNYYDGFQKIPYLKAIMSPDNINNLILYDNNDDHIDFVNDNGIVTTYLEIQIRNSNNDLEHTITQANPAYIEIEFI